MPICTFSFSIYFHYMYWLGVDSFPLLLISNPTYSCLLAPKSNRVHVHGFHFTSSDTERSFCKFLLLYPPFGSLHSIVAVLLCGPVTCMAHEIKLHLHALHLFIISIVWSLISPIYHNVCAVRSLDYLPPLHCMNKYIGRFPIYVVSLSWWHFCFPVFGISTENSELCLVCILLDKYLFQLPVMCIHKTWYHRYVFGVSQLFFSCA